MKCKLFCLGMSLLVFGSNVYADAQTLQPVKEPKKLVTEKDEVDIRVNRDYRANPYANTPSYAQGGDTSRYSTAQGWSRGRGGYWWGGSSHSDIPTAGYTRPSSR